MTSSPKPPAAANAASPKPPAAANAASPKASSSGRGVPAPAQQTAQAKPARPDSSADALSKTRRVSGTVPSGPGLSPWPAGKLFGVEFMLAVSINSWQALKLGQVPFPGMICRTAAAFGILSLVYYVDDDLAAVLGAGFLLALLVKSASGGFQVFGADDPDGAYYYLTFGSSGNG